MLLTFDAGFEIERSASFSPFDPGRNQIQIVSCELGRRSSRGRGKPDLRMLALVNRADERDALTVRRPSRRVVSFVMVGNLDQRSARRRDYPHIGVAAFVKGFASPVGYERYSAAIRRPLRVRVVPVLTRGYLLFSACIDVDDPQVAAAIVEPAGVVEFVRQVRVVANVAAIPRFGVVVAWSGPAQADEPGPIRGPLEAAGTIFEIGYLPSFSAVHRQSIDLVLRLARYSRAGWNRCCRREGRRLARLAATPTIACRHCRP